MALTAIEESHMRDRVETFRARMNGGLRRELELLTIAIEAHHSGHPAVVLDHMERVHTALTRLAFDAAKFDPDND